MEGMLSQMTPAPKRGNGPPSAAARDGAAIAVTAPETKARQARRCRKKIKNNTGKIFAAAATAIRAPAQR